MNGATFGYGVTWGATDVILMHLKAGKIYVKKNNVYMNGADPIAGTGWMFSGVAGFLFPACSMNPAGDISQVRFIAADITSTLPAGCSAWG
jgi:hypothetical protein